MVDAQIIARLQEWEDGKESDGTNVKEKLVLYALIRHYEPSRVIEVGVSAGGATSWIAAALEANGGGHLDSVDDWSRSDGGKADGPEKPRKRLQELGIAERVTFHTASSHDWLPEQESGSADIVWVDGDHSYDGAKDDMVHACRIATDLVIFHDSDHLAGPMRLADELEHRGVRMPNSRGFLLVNP